MAGRGIRHHLLVGPSGKFRDDLWLDGLVTPPEICESDSKEVKPVLSSPLPINYCSVDSLTLLPGVGPVLAGRIDEMRRQGVIFGSLEGLREVKGIGPALSERLDSLVVFGVRNEPLEPISP